MKHDARSEIYVHDWLVKIWSRLFNAHTHASPAVAWICIDLVRSRDTENVENKTSVLPGKRCRSVKFCVFNQDSRLWLIFCGQPQLHRARLGMCQRQLAQHLLSRHKSDSHLISTNLHEQRLRRALYTHCLTILYALFRSGGVRSQVHNVPPASRSHAAFCS